MTIDLEKLYTALHKIAENLETQCRTASDPLAVVDSMADELRFWANRIDSELNRGYS